MFPLNLPLCWVQRSFMGRCPQRTWECERCAFPEWRGRKHPGTGRRDLSCINVSMYLRCVGVDDFKREFCEVCTDAPTFLTWRMEKWVDWDHPVGQVNGLRPSCRMRGGLGEVVVVGVMWGGFVEEIFGCPCVLESGTFLWKGDCTQAWCKEQRSRNLRPNPTTKWLSDLDKSLNLFGAYLSSYPGLACQGAVKVSWWGDSFGGASILGSW